MPVWVAFLLLGVSFFFLAKSASWFVDGAVGIAETFKVSKLVIGIVLVAFATTAPEFAVSVQSALLGHPEIALGNAIGSVIVDDGVALALASILSPMAIAVNRSVLWTAGIFLIGVDLMAYALASNGVLDRMEGLLLIGVFFGYVTFVIIRQLKGRDMELEEPAGHFPTSHEKGGLRPFVLFVVGLAGVILSSRGVIESSLFIARALHLSEAVIGLTIIAMGTSLPEISTCIAAATKGEGQIAVGDIIGADIMNICWIAGASAAVNPIHVSERLINFAFPFMILIVTVMLVCMRWRYRLIKAHGFVLIMLYCIYLGLTIHLFY